MTKILSNTELYYTKPGNILNDKIILEKDEVKHLVQVMRNKTGDLIKVTDGIGNIFDSEISELQKDSATLLIKKKEFIDKKISGIRLFLPILKIADRLEFAIEKCVELGFTDISVYYSDKSYKRGLRVDRLNKIALAAMKQSLNPYLPSIDSTSKLSDIVKTENYFILDQLAEKSIYEIIKEKILHENIALVIGPEGGFSEIEYSMMDYSRKIFITKNRLRTETAVISAASIISSYISNKSD